MSVIRLNAKRGLKSLYFILPCLLFLCFPKSSVAQNWSGILSSSRATNWTQAGVVGGVPSANWSQCGKTIAAYSGTAAAINSAMAACSPNTYVLLGAGSFSLTSTITMVPNVVLRGSGANSTLIVFTNSGNSCGGLGGDVCFADSVGWYYGSTAIAPGGTYSANWTGGYAQGSTSITLASVGSTGITNGNYIYLDQINDNSAASTGLVVCDNNSTPCSLEAGSPGRCSTGPGGSACTGGIDRNQVQIVKVVSGCASACTGAGPFTLTISPGLYAANWRASQSPGAWWSSSNMQNSGIENLSMDHSGSTTDSGIFFNNAYNCWVSGVRDLDSVRNHVWFWQSAHITVQNNYFFATQNGQEESYGTESFISSDNLVVNNIFQQVTTPLMMGPAQGSAFLYNFAINDKYALTSTFAFESIYGNHDAGGLYNLFEGNISSGYEGDVFHGTGGLNTVFRNYFVGWESGKSTNTVAFQLFSYNRFDNVVGNVLGCNNSSASFPGNCGAPYATSYQTANGASASQAIYDLGMGNTEGSTVVPTDKYTITSLFRWGNYDVVNAAVQWNSSEVPSALTDGYSNPVPASQTLPASFAFSSAPAWWPSAKAWPLIGPDVTGGNIPGVAGHAYTNAAADCYLSTLSGPPDGSGSPLSFNASTCYGAGATQKPALLPPTNLSAVSH